MTIRIILCKWDNREICCHYAGSPYIRKGAEVLEQRALVLLVVLDSQAPWELRVRVYHAMIGHWKCSVGAEKRSIHNWGGGCQKS